MGHIRFWRRFKVFPGVFLNISKSGISFSFGVRGAKYTVGPKGHRKTFGIPGTGLFHTSKKKWSKKKVVEEAKTNSSDLDNLRQKIIGAENGKAEEAE